MSLFQRLIRVRLKDSLCDFNVIRRNMLMLLKRFFLACILVVSGFALAHADLKSKRETLEELQTASNKAYQTYQAFRTPDNYEKFVEAASEFNKYYNQQNEDPSVKKFDDDKSSVISLALRDYYFRLKNNLMVAKRTNDNLARLFEIDSNTDRGDDAVASDTMLRPTQFEFPSDLLLEHRILVMQIRSYLEGNEKLYHLVTRELDRMIAKLSNSRESVHNTIAKDYQMFKEVIADVHKVRKPLK